MPPKNEEEEEQETKKMTEVDPEVKNPIEEAAETAELNDA